MIVDVVIPFYRDAERIEPTLDAVLAQDLPPGWELNLVVVDDGTPDGGRSAAQTAERYPAAEIVRLEVNGGRSEACNRGVAAGDGDVVLIIDNDCVLRGSGVVAGHVRHLERADVSLGAVVSAAPGVWGELGNRVAENRRSAAESSKLALLTTQHVAFCRLAFEKVGGFSNEYRQYGFEDRDLLARVESAGCDLVYDHTLIAVEHDQPTLVGYVAKARMAGEHTAATFRRDHPHLYALTPYRRLDVGVHPWLRPVARIARWLLPGLVRLGDRAIRWSWLPMGLRVFVVRALFATSFMVGTSEAAQP